MDFPPNLGPNSTGSSVCEPPARKRPTVSRRISSSLSGHMYKVRTIIDNPRTSPGLYRICCSVHGKFYNPIPDFSCKLPPLSSPIPLRHPCPFCLHCLPTSPSSPSKVIVAPISLLPSPSFSFVLAVSPLPLYSLVLVRLFRGTGPMSLHCKISPPLTTSQYKQVHKPPISSLRKLSAALATNPPRSG